MGRTVFTGSGVAIVTPMREDFSINYDELGRIIDWQIENETDAIVICGTTGESTTMTDSEHVECIRYAVERTAGRVPVIAGAGSNDTSYAIWLSKEAEQAGADALLHVTPYYNKTSQRGLVRHFTAIADATPLPMLLYNVPPRTGLNILPETYHELSRHPNIVGTKEANSDLKAALETVYLCGDAFDLYVGNDNEITAFLSIGGKGVISVIANVMPKETHDICSLFFGGRADEAARMQVKYAGFMKALSCDVNPIPVKHALNLMGYKAGPCRMPLVELSSANAAHVAEEMKKLGLL